MKRPLSWVSLLVVAIIPVACASPGRATRGLKEPAEMSRAILGVIPVGSDLAEAEQFMVGQGFDCRREVGAEFLDRKGIDYLYCNRYEGGLVQRRWQVAIVYRGGKVTEVLASTGLIGP